MRQITFQVDDKVYDRLTKMGAEGGKPTGAYARLLFEAAYAARCGATGDAALDDQVARAGLLWGAGLDTAEIARLTGMPEHRAVRIIGAWRDELARIAA